MHFQQICEMHILIFGGHACESTWLHTMLLFLLLPVGVCIDVNFILAYTTVAVMSRACQLISHLQLFIREDTVTKEMSVINEPAHIAVGCNYLKCFLSQHLYKQFWMFALRYIFQRVLF